MQNIKVLYLNGCELCNELKESLDKENIKYIPLEANENDSLADSVEELLGISNYPIVIIEQGKETIFVFVTDNGVKLGIRRLAANVTAIGCVEIEIAVKNVLSLLK